MRIHFVVPCSPHMPSGIVRVEGYLGRLRAMGIECTVVNYFSPALRRNRWRWEGPRRHRSAIVRRVVRAGFTVIDAVHIWRARIGLLLAARSADAIVLQWIAPPVWLTRRMTAGRARLIYDFDDAVHLVNGERVDEVLRLAWRVVAGSHALHDHARSITPAAVLIPSPVAAERFVPATRAPATRAPDESAAADDAPAVDPSRPFRVGWLGSAGTLPYLSELTEPLARLARSGIAVQLFVAGTDGRVDLVPAPHGVEVVQLARYSGDDMPGITSRMDVGVMPMPDGPWERGKCAMKALIYMAGGLPVVCSPVGENVHVVEEGVSGLHASTPDEWFDALNRLARSGELRHRLGRAGRARVEAGYTTEHCFELLRQHVLAPLGSRDAAERDPTERDATERDATERDATERRAAAGARSIGQRGPVE